jgi:hypothetical protein
MEIVLAIINAALLWAVWYFLGRGSIYAKLIKEYRGALKLIGFQQAIIEAYKRKYESKETEQEDGEQD